MACSHQKKSVSFHNRGATVHRSDGPLVNLATRLSLYYQVDRLSAAKKFAISLSAASCSLDGWTLEEWEPY
jgi:hypothetical protein